MSWRLPRSPRPDDLWFQYQTRAPCKVSGVSYNAQPLNGRMPLQPMPNVWIWPNTTCVAHEPCETATTPRASAANHSLVCAGCTKPSIPCRLYESGGRSKLRLWIEVANTKRGTVANCAYELHRGRLPLTIVASGSNQSTILPYVADGAVQHHCKSHLLARMRGKRRNKKRQPVRRGSRRSLPLRAGAGSCRI